MMPPDKVIRGNEPLVWPNGLCCGVDEAGRGPLAGPVFAAAVILDQERIPQGLKDSKKIPEPRRIDLEGRIKTVAMAWSVANASVQEIDELNILQATLLAMRRAVEALVLVPEVILVDGLFCPNVAGHRMAVVKGDQRVLEISAASILAKTARDRWMLSLSDQWPQYQFERHKGYPTPLHLKVLAQHGPCPHHRQSFGPVRDCSCP